MQIVLVAKCIVIYEIKIMNLFGMNLFRKNNSPIDYWNLNKYTLCYSASWLKVVLT